MILFQKSILLDNYLKVIADTYNNDLKLKKIIISIHLRNLVKIQDYTVFQSICLLDTLCGQKPTLNISKFRYSLGTKSLTYSCKATLRSRNLDLFLYFFNIIVLSEMKRRYITCNSDLNSSNHYTFSLKSINVFVKLDEFYFKWNKSIFLNIIYHSKYPVSILPLYINHNFTS